MDAEATRKGGADPKRDRARAIERLAQRLVAARSATGLTQEALALAAGVTPRYLQKLESGVGNPSYVKLLAIAAALRRHGKTLLSVP
jgi:transcriptional regulator with XRE-family HTH domain